MADKVTAAIDRLGAAALETKDLLRQVHEAEQSLRDTVRTTERIQVHLDQSVLRVHAAIEKELGRLSQMVSDHLVDEIAKAQPMYEALVIKSMDDAVKNIVDVAVDAIITKLSSSGALGQLQTAMSRRTPIDVDALRKRADDVRLDVLYNGPGGLRRPPSRHP